MLASEIKTASHLRMFIEESGNCPHFFDRNTMRGFGDTMKNYGVCKTLVVVGSGIEIEAWELYRRKPVKFGNQASAYFHPATFIRLHPRKIIYKQAF